MEKPERIRGTDVSFKTTCCYCGVGCGMVVTKDPDGRLLVKGDPEHPVNRGMLCSKGINLHYTAMDRKDRLLYPMIRSHRGGPLKRTGWPEAIGTAVRRFREITDRDGPDAVGFYISGQCLTEEYYLVNKIAKGFIGTNNIDTNSRLCMSSAVSAYKQALGEDSVPGCYEDIELADTLLIAGANPAWCHPVLYRRIEAHKAGNPQVKIIVVDPRRTETAAQADLHLQINPGTDIVLFHAIARGLIENGFIDEAFIRDHTEGFEELKQKVMERSLQDAAAVCGIRFTDIYRAIKYIGYSGGFISLWAMGLNQSVSGVAKNLALINLSLITGKIGKPGCGPFSLTGQANAMGGREVGGMATLASAHRDLDNPEHLREIADCWGVPSVPSAPGLTATAMFGALRDGKMKGIWIICTNPAVSMPDANLVDQALQRAEFVIVQDMSGKADTLAYADLVLPAATWPEKEGTMTNSERRISHLSRVLDPPEEALSDVDILIRFAEAMGWGRHFRYSHPGEIYAEHARLSRHTRVDVSGLDYERLKNQGSFQWPVPAKTDAGTPRLFTDHLFYRPGGRACIVAVPEEKDAEALTPDHPLVLTTGRIRDQWHTMTRTGNVNNLSRHIRAPFLEIHPADAETRGIEAGDPVTVSNPRGSVRVTAVVTDAIKKGVVFLPMHWGRIAGQTAARANNLTAMRVDAVSRQPDFKYSAVAVSRYRKPAEQILIWGEGEEVLSFIRKYRSLNQEDEVRWLCGPDPVVQGREEWQHYLLGEPGRPLPSLEQSLASSGVTLVRTRAPGRIDGERKVVVTEKDIPYDKLILTGTYAREDENVPGLYLVPGSRRTADRMRRELLPGSVWVVEATDPEMLSLAAALAERDVTVHLLIPEVRPLAGLADSTAGRLIERLLRRSGVILHAGCRLVSVISRSGGSEALLDDGHIISCAGAVRPARRRMPGLVPAASGGGVWINGYLQTKLPDIFAIGELTLLNGSDKPGAGIRQATCLADYLHGNLLNPYQDVPFSLHLEIAGTVLRIVGDIRMPDDRKPYEEVMTLDERRSYYKKCVILNDRLTGGLFLGDDREYEAYSTLIREGSELGAKREEILRSAADVETMNGRMVCSCGQVGEGNILKAIQQGCGSVEEIGERTGAGTRCGSCRPELAAILKQNH